MNSQDLNGASCDSSGADAMNLLKEPSGLWYQSNSSGRQSPFNCSLNQSTLNDSIQPDYYWAYKPPPRLNISHNLAHSQSKQRSVSFSDPLTSGYTTTHYNLTADHCDHRDHRQLFRERLSSVPLHSPQEPLVTDDIFPFTPEPMESHLCYPPEPMVLSEVLSRKKEQKSSNSRGWLEVSIDSTMPTSPVLHKDSFSLSELQTTLPSSPVKSLLPKRVVISPPSAVTAPTSSCLLKKLMPSPSDDTYSRKVFIGGLPPDIDQEEIRMSFQKYGSVTIDWPHKIHSKSRVPPKGYAFLLFKDEGSVHKLLACCIGENDKLFSFIKYYVSGTTITRKKCQIRPWKISESFYFANEDKKVDSRKAVFVGGVPRPLKAGELAEVMTDKFGSVSFVAIDCDSELKYPKGAACVVFATHASYIAAVSSRFMQLVFGTLEKKVEVKPYILEDQLCDECNGIQSDGQPAPFFCGSVTCLKYYCEHCWATYHSLSGRQNHRPMFKDIFDRDKFS